MVIDYQRVKTLVKDFSLKNSFGQILLFNILKNSFYTFLNGSCISWVFSWFFTWILILDWMTLWFLKLAWILIFDWKTLWFLKLAWILIIDLSFGIIKISLKALLLQSPPFWLWQSWNQENTCKICYIVHSSLSPPFFLNSCLNLNCILDF